MKRFDFQRPTTLKLLRHIIEIQQIIKEFLKIRSFCQGRPLLLLAPTVKKPSHATGRNCPSHDSVGRARKCVEPEIETRSFTGLITGICPITAFYLPPSQCGRTPSTMPPMDFGSRGALNDTQSSLLDDDKLHRFPTPIPLENVSMAQTTADIWELSDVW